MEIVLISLLSATAKFILLCRLFPVRKMLWFDKWIDLFFVVLLPFVFYGTFSGMVTAVLSGLFLSLFLIIAKAALGSQPPDWVVRARVRRNP